MKRTILAVIAFILALPVALSAQSDIELDKTSKRNFYTKKRELKKEGWKLYGSTKTLDDVLLSHYQKLAKLGENAEEIIGNASKCDSKDIGHMLAFNNAASKYTQKCNNTLRGSTQSVLSSGNGQEMDQFYSTYQSQVEVAIKGELQESFSVVREVGHGMYEMQSFFILNKNRAAMVHLTALEKMESQFNTATFLIKEYHETEEKTEKEV